MNYTYNTTTHTIRPHLPGPLHGTTTPTTPVKPVFHSETTTQDYNSHNNAIDVSLPEVPSDSGCRAVCVCVLCVCAALGNKDSQSRFRRH
jgi:hypothetical protein